MNFEQKKLDDRALAYFRRCFEFETAFSKQILEKFDFNLGSVVTYAPVEISESRLYNFENGGLLSELILPKRMENAKGQHVLVENVKSQEQWLSNYIYDRVKFGSTHVLFDDVLAKKGDAHLDRFPLQPNFVEDEIYWIVEDQNLSASTFSQIIRSTQLSWHFVAALYSPNCEFSKSTEEVESFNNLIKQVNELIIGAYDGEGYLIWRRC